MFAPLNWTKNMWRLVTKRLRRHGLAGCEAEAERLHTVFAHLNADLIFAERGKDP